MHAKKFKPVFRDLAERPFDAARFARSFLETLGNRANILKRVREINTCHAVARSLRRWAAP